MKKKTLLLLFSLLLVFTLSGCFGNYRDGYRIYSKTVGTHDLYYKDLDDDAACPNEADHLYTLYSTDGNTFKYKGIRTGDGCYVELLAEAGTGFTSISNLLRDEHITVVQLENVAWTFNFVVEQTPDHTLGTINFIEYFEEIGDYEVFVIDYETTICHNGGAVTLFEYNGVEYDVLGAPTGDGCSSEYFIYYEEEAEADEDPVEGVLMTVNDALQEGYISIAEINNATFESDVYETYRELQVLATEATIYFVNGEKEYNQSNPYTLTNEERNSIVSILATTKYRYVADETEENIPYITLRDDESNEHMFQIYDIVAQETTETAIAILVLTDGVGNYYSYHVYPTGIQIINEELIVYADFLNQTYIIDLLDNLDE